MQSANLFARNAWSPFSQPLVSRNERKSRRETQSRDNSSASDGLREGATELPRSLTIRSSSRKNLRLMEARPRISSQRVYVRELDDDCAAARPQIVSASLSTTFFRLTTRAETRGRERLLSKAAIATS